MRTKDFGGGGRYTKEIIRREKDIGLERVREKNVKKLLSYTIIVRLFLK